MPEASSNASRNALLITVALVTYAGTVGIGATCAGAAGVLAPPPPEKEFANAYVFKCECRDTTFPNTGGTITPPGIACMTAAMNANVGGFGFTADDVKLDMAFRVCPALANAMDQRDNACGMECTAVVDIDTSANFKAICNDYNRNCANTALNICKPAMCSDGACTPTFCLDPPNVLLDPVEALARRDITFDIIQPSSITLSVEDRSATAQLRGIAELLAEPCSSQFCPTEGQVFGQVADFKVGDVNVTNVSVSMSFNGAIDTATGAVVIPGSAATVTALMLIDGQRRTLEPAADAPIRGTFDAAAGTLTLGGRFVDSQGQEFSFSLTAAMTSRPPTAQAGADQTIECAANGRASVTLDGSGSTPGVSGQSLSYMWEVIEGPNAGAVLGREAQLNTTLQLGHHVLQLSVRDSNLRFAADRLTVDVADTSPPTIEAFSFEPSCLWPPSHDYVRYELGGETVTLVVRDACDPSPTVTFASVLQDDGAAKGSGNTAPDTVLSPQALCVRSERSGIGDGRTYTATVRAVDASGNAATAQSAIRVPHDQSASGCRGKPSTFVSEEECR